MTLLLRDDSGVVQMPRVSAASYWQCHCSDFGCRGGRSMNFKFDVIKFYNTSAFQPKDAPWPFVSSSFPRSRCRHQPRRSFSFPGGCRLPCDPVFTLAQPPAGSLQVVHAGRFANVRLRRRSQQRLQERKNLRGLHVQQRRVHVFKLDTRGPHRQVQLQVVHGRQWPKARRWSRSRMSSPMRPARRLQALVVPVPPSSAPSV